MKLHFLGGADEVGASCTLIEIEGRRILVDAGIRMGAAQGSQLPNFSVLDDVGMPDEVLITHAHTDHTGALPVLVNSLPADVKVYSTPATQAITRVLLSDAVKLMAQDRDGELPLYPPEAADEALGRMVGVPWLATVPICDGALTATWIPAGHILGAALIYIEGVSESVLMTGDVSVANQLTIPGMVVPQCRPDVMVMESTYGNRQHADRAQQEAALALRVAEVIEAGGKVLVPAFAVGRSQEVILILARAMRRKQIPEFPVFVDGMVRSVNAVYSAFGDDLAPAVRRRAERGEDVFYSDAVGAVSSPADRRRVLSGPPCCIVASSGMLIGGASSFYAERLAGDAANLIAITGYQDEESPGRALLDLMQAKDPEERALMLNGQRISVACQVEPYSLSAHADGGELTGLVQRLKPRTCFLVHGDSEARGALSSMVDVYLPEGVQLPENGGAYSVEAMRTMRQRGYGRRVSRAGIAGGRALSDDTLAEVHNYVLETGAQGPFRAQELAEIWFGTEMTTPSEVEAFRLLLSGSREFFEPDYRRAYLFHPKEVSEAGPMEMNEARTHIMSIFPPEAGLFKCSAYVDDGVYELAFYFPDVVQEQYGETLLRLEDETGWSLRLRETPHQGRLFEEARGAVPAGARVLKAPALHLDQKAVVLAVDVGEVDDWERVSGETAAGFKAKTGFDLILDWPGGVKTEVAIKREDAWEINKAYSEIRKVFGDQPHAPSKMGLKSGSYIEVAFISSQVGNRYRGLLNAVGERIGWEIRVRPSANQDEIAREARAMTPEECVVCGAAKIYLNENRVVVPVAMVPEDAGARAPAFEECTGFTIEWEVG
ncbi:MAG: MBL fold metallo-hydrolase [Gemmatimonadetes bacterium]|nr:MBL fold metallo-hydrolase [Gemmatimonadota bacterium]MYB59520.1 MBL fold metallo-hydrolase [Gemmatimonadota bacterium]